MHHGSPNLEAKLSNITAVFTRSLAVYSLMVVERQPLSNYKNQTSYTYECINQQSIC